MTPIIKGALASSFISATIAGAMWIAKRVHDKQEIERMRHDETINELFSCLEDCEKKQLMLSQPQIEKMIPKYNDI